MHPDWTNATVAILASGPSLNHRDVCYARDRAERVIAINESWRLCVDADVLYAADFEWWRQRAPTEEHFKGSRWTQNRGWPAGRVPPKMNVIDSKPGHDIDPSLPFIYDGMNSSFQALSLAVKWGAKRVVFLGLDMGRPGDKTHWHGDHEGTLRNDSPYPAFRKQFELVAPQLNNLGVLVINASPVTELKCFSLMDITDALP